jgi:hypothetical protein
VQSRIFQGAETRSRPRHGSAQLSRFDDLPDEALTTCFVAEVVLGKGRSTIDALRRAGVLETVKQGRTVRIKVGSIRRALASK